MGTERFMHYFCHKFRDDKVYDYSENQTFHLKMLVHILSVTHTVFTFLCWLWSGDLEWDSLLFSNCLGSLLLVSLELEDKLVYLSLGNVVCIHHIRILRNQMVKEGEVFIQLNDFVEFPPCWNFCFLKKCSVTPPYPRIELITWPQLLEHVKNLRCAWSHVLVSIVILQHA